MPHALSFRSHLAGVTLGLIGAIVLLALLPRPGMAEKEPTFCGAGRASVCKLVETCEPKGFEANGTCKWIYTASRSYWSTA